MLEVQLLETGAKAPTVAHAGEDLGYDVFALEDIVLPYGQVVAVRTGIAVAAYKPRYHEVRTGIDNVHRATLPDHEPLGLLIRDRSSMALKGVVTSGGVIDAGYRGEIKVLLTNWRGSVDHLALLELLRITGPVPEPNHPYVIGAGDKIAQMIPLEVLTGTVYIKGQLGEAVRGVAGFGSTGR
jgi:dUTP pyrophosphatase